MLAVWLHVDYYDVSHYDDHDYYTNDYNHNHNHNVCYHDWAIGSVVGVLRFMFLEVLWKPWMDKQVCGMDDLEWREI